MRQSLEFLDLDDKDVAADDATTFLQWQHRLQYARPVKKGFFFVGKIPESSLQREIPFSTIGLCGSATQPNRPDVGS